MVAPALIGALVGAGYGALTYEDDKKRADELRKQNATFESTSPWTGVHGSTVAAPSMMGHVASGALSGASFGMQDAFNKKDNPTSAPGDAGGAVTANTPGGAGQNYPAAQPFNGQGPTMAQQNPPAGSQIHYENPNAPGFSPWASMQPQQGRPPYRAPGT